MYVCVCKAVTESQIKQAIHNGACTRKQLFHCFGVGGDCGKCNRQVKEILDEEKRQHAIMQQSSNQPILSAC